MSFITYISPPPKQSELPQEIESPFGNTPHPLARQASKQLQKLLAIQTEWQHDFHSPDGGKMFGVLVVKDSDGRIGFLSAFSGMLAGQWELPGFVPPVFDPGARTTFLPEGEAALARYTQEIRALESSGVHGELQARLSDLMSLRDRELQLLKEQHNSRKAQRQKQRVDLAELIMHGAHEIETDKQLELLSYESQRDKRERRKLHAQWSERLLAVQQQLDDTKCQITSLKEARAGLSRELHDRVFSTYVLTNILGEHRPLQDLFREGQPPGGAGDCAAPKLLQYAHQYKLMPLALAEFWWGAPPHEGVRHHAHYYPACRGKCQAILPFMLKGLVVKQLPVYDSNNQQESKLTTVYEDADLLVVNKPCGLLSVPGKTIRDSVLTRMQHQYPSATGPLLVHRLDQSTSGLLLVAKTAVAHKVLQKQFQRRLVEKRYVAVLSKCLARASANGNDNGTIDLPLRVDMDDRPRQVVCFSHGKKATTRWQVIAREQDCTRVYFYPLTGRTHQLRVHAAHQDGLNAPIVGDGLYGVEADRLLLHAERLRFRHPVSGKSMEVTTPPKF